MFRLPYTYIDICKDGSGALKCFELNGGVGQQSPFVHSCASVSWKKLSLRPLTVVVHTTKLPVPHLEHPRVPDELSLRISFLEEQTVQTAHTVFMAQISYTFEDWRGRRPPRPQLSANTIELT